MTILTATLRLSLLFLLTLLSGCSLFKTKLDLPQNLTPDARAAFLARADYWKLDGRIGIIANNESESANISWTQSGDATTLRIYGALGATYALLHATPGYAKLELSDDEIYEGSSAQQLLWQRTGWNIPVEHLRFWLLGLHNNAPSYQLNDQGYVANIDFQYWAINFQQYQSFGGLIMPKKIRAQHPEIVLKFAIYDWEFSR